MGVKGLYSCLKSLSVPIQANEVPPCRIALDAYPLLYKFKQDLDACERLLKSLSDAGHTCTIYVDGTPPKEKLEELASRRQQKDKAIQQAEALKAFLNDPEKSGALDEDARKVLEAQIRVYEVESYSIKREVREAFLRRLEEQKIPIVFCEGESDDTLIQASLKGLADIVIANDMDLFVGGVERLWMLGKTATDPLFLEFQLKEISKQLGIQPTAWADVAILAGYEKVPQLKRTSAQQAIIWMRYYGSVENLLGRRKELLQGATLEEFVGARKFFDSADEKKSV
jgi:hypothetical protein